MNLYYQQDYWSCGAVSIRNALSTLGIKQDFKTIKSLARTNRGGTSKAGIVRALSGLGFRPTVYQTRNPDLAWRWIRHWTQTRPCIVLLDEMLHWGLVSGSFLNRVTLIDSYPTDGHEMGVYLLNKQELLERWTGRGVYYAIRVDQ